MDEHSEDKMVRDSLMVKSSLHPVTCERELLSFIPEVMYCCRFSSDPRVDPNMVHALRRVEHQKQSVEFESGDCNMPQALFL